MKFRKIGDKCDTEMDLKPFMNLMVVLIPILLLSAEFAKISIIDIKLPKDRGVNPPKRDTSPNKDESNKLILTAMITDSAITLLSRTSILPSITYKEFHKYVAKDDQCSFIVEHKMDSKVFHPKTHREMNLNEREDIELYAVDKNRNIINTYYTEQGELLLDNSGHLISNIKVGDTLFTSTSPKRLLIVSNLKDFNLRALSAYDVLKSNLINIKERYKNVEDSNEIIITAEKSVLYDKIIKIMDVARASQYPEIQIAKLRKS